MQVDISLVLKCLNQGFQPITEIQAQIFGPAKETSLTGITDVMFKSRNKGTFSSSYHIYSESISSSLIYMCLSGP